MGEKLMERKRLSAGIRFAKVKNCVSVMCERKVKVNAKGQWKFMKMSTKKSKKR